MINGNISSRLIHKGVFSFVFRQEQTEKYNSNLDHNIDKGVLASFQAMTEKQDPYKYTGPAFFHYNFVLPLSLRALEMRTRAKVTLEAMSDVLLIGLLILAAALNGWVVPNALKDNDKHLRSFVFITFGCNLLCSFVLAWTIGINRLLTMQIVLVNLTILSFALIATFFERTVETTINKAGLFFGKITDKIIRSFNKGQPSEDKGFILQMAFLCAVLFGLFGIVLIQISNVIILSYVNKWIGLLICPIVGAVIFLLLAMVLGRHQSNKTEQLNEIEQSDSDKRIIGQNLTIE